LVVKVRHVDAHVPKSRATEEQQNNQQLDQGTKIELAQVNLDWQRKGELFIAPTNLLRQVLYAYSGGSDHQITQNHTKW